MDDLGILENSLRTIVPLVVIGFVLIVIGILFASWMVSRPKRSKEENKKVIKMYILIGTGILILSVVIFLFYQYSYRPQMIMKSCESIYQLDQSTEVMQRAYYDCLKKNGLP